MPRLSGHYLPVLRVTDVALSAQWYANVLGLVESSRYIDPDGSLHQVLLSHEATGLQLCLVGPGSGSAFDESTTGLDHLELLIPTRSDLGDWVVTLDRLEVSHSGVKEPLYSNAALVTFRDPDNIQLELYCAER